MSKLIAEHLTMVALAVQKKKEKVLNKHPTMKEDYKHEAWVLKLLVN